MYCLRKSFAEAHCFPRASLATKTWCLFLRFFGERTRHLRSCSAVMSLGQLPRDFTADQRYLPVTYVTTCPYQCVDVIDAGLIVLDSDWRIRAWNEWMTMASGISTRAHCYR